MSCQRRSGGAVAVTVTVGSAAVGSTVVSGGSVLNAVVGAGSRPPVFCPSSHGCFPVSGTGVYSASHCGRWPRDIYTRAKGTYLAGGSRAAAGGGRPADEGVEFFEVAALEGGVLAFGVVSILDVTAHL